MKNLLSMKTPVLALFISLVAFGACVSNKQTQPSTDYTQLVNPFIGTDFTGNNNILQITVKIHPFVFIITFLFYSMTGNKDKRL
jgi:predicted metalloenzyme YecM